MAETQLFSNLRRSLSHGFCALSILTVAIASGAAPAAAPDRLHFRGVNLAGAAFGSSHIPGKVNKNYVYPNAVDIDYFINRGMNVFRLPFLWERLQLNLGWEFEADELQRIDRVVNHVTRQGAHLILDVHNYARYFGKEIGSKYVPSAVFASFWGELARRYKDNERVIFGLMNEPYGIRADRWRQSAEAAIAAIRETGARNLILVPGTAWSGASSWMKPRDGISNAEAFLTLTDPADNMAFDIHQYFDRDFSGTSDQCQSEDIGVKTLEGVTAWMRQTGHKGFLGEFGAANNPVCLEALDRTLKYMADNSDVWIGWAYWAAGAWWGDYMFSVHPPKDGGEKPQMKVLMRYLEGP